MPRKSEQEWAIIENEYITMPLTYNTLSKKHNVSAKAICDRFKGKDLEKRRQNHLTKTSLKIEEGQIKDAVKDRKNLINTIEGLINLKIDIETKAHLQSLNSGNLKILLSTIKSSKTPLPELIKCFLVLKGEASDIIGFTPDEQDDVMRKNRVERLGFN